MKCIHIHLARVSEIEPGDIIRSPRNGGHMPFAAWARVDGVEVSDVVTRVTTFRPGTTDGVITDSRGVKMDAPDVARIRVVQNGVTLSSWELVEVQGEIDGFGRAR